MGIRKDLHIDKILEMPRVQEEFKKNLKKFIIEYQKKKIF